MWGSEPRDSVTLLSLMGKGAKKKGSAGLGPTLLAGSRFVVTNAVCVLPSAPLPGCWVLDNVVSTRLSSLLTYRSRPGSGSVEVRALGFEAGAIDE